MIRALATILILAIAVPVLAQEEALLLRYPHRQGDRIAFVKGGDIWVGTISSGTARRLTSHDEGLELFPRISPDGEWVAFSAEYSGTRQVFVAPFSGGEPKQLTFYPDVGPMPPRGGYDNLPYDWTPDGNHILVRMNRTPYGQRVGRYFLVDPTGEGLERSLAVPEGGSVTFSPDGKKLAYNVISREWRTWKRYKAGRAQDVWTFDLESNEAKRLTSWEGTDVHPMWLGDRIYFVSDRSGTLNLWVHDLATGEERPITTSSDRDITFPSRGEGGLVFECDGKIWEMEADTEEVKALSFKLVDDRPFMRASWKELKRPGSFDLGPKAKEIVVEHRGELFFAPTGEGEPYPLMTTPARRERAPRWSPDGRHIAYLAEAGDDYEIFLFDRKEGTERQLSRDSGAWIMDMVFSPDGETLAFTDRIGRLRIIDVAGGEVRMLDGSRFGGISSIAWSADSSWLAWRRSEENGLSSIRLTKRGGGDPVTVSAPEFSATSPAFDPEGRYLWFVSARDFNYGDLDFQQRVFGLLLRKDVANPLEPQPELEPFEEEKKDEGEEKDGEEETEELVIDFDGLAERMIVLPLPPGSYGALHGEKGGLLMRAEGELAFFDLEEREKKTVLEGVRGYRAAAGSAKMAYRHRSNICIAQRRPGQKAGKDAVDLSLVKVRVDPRVEWRQMFFDAWRIVRDWFYEPTLHKVDWLAVRKRYEPLLDDLSHRSELDHVFGEMIGELNVGHAYVQSGEQPGVERTEVGCLGCELEPAEKGYRIGRIFASENWTRDGRNPLRDPGVDVKEGDVLLAIDGIALDATMNPYRLLEGKVGRRVRLSIRRGEKEHEAVIRPIGSETRLRYLDWVARNREIVESRSGGRIGYVHVPNTAVEGHRRFFEGMRAYARTREALIIDDRYNGGGFIPDRMARFLTTKPLNYWARRGAELYPTPANSYAGYSVMLINGYSSSGGDAFPYYYRKLGGGPLIGTTTWGGLVGISGEPGLIDGGRIKVPAFAFVNDEGEWAVEAEGVDPDLEVVDDPGLIARGQQPVLEYAIDHLLKKLRAEPPVMRPEVPEGPDRSK